VGIDPVEALRVAILAEQEDVVPEGAKDFARVRGDDVRS
jgi:hypothetical protein